MADGGCGGADVGPRRVYVRWSEGLGARLLARLADGELLYRILKEPGMPTPEAVAKWAKAKPAFGEALAAARRKGGRPPGQRGPVSTYSDGVAQEIFERTCEGESLTKIGADPTMPSVSTIFNWRTQRPEFEAMMQLAMRVRAERLCDLGWDMAEAATPETAYLTSVRLGQLRWTAGVMAPWTFRPRTVQPAAAEKPARRLLMRHFVVEVDPATGKKRTVAYCPNPDTGEVEREDEPDWRQAPWTVALPGGRGG